MNAPVRIGHAVTSADLGNAHTVERIEGFVRDQSGTLFHRPAWLRGIEAATGHRARGLISEKLGVMTGWLPLTEIRSLLFGNTLVSSGFGVGGGILAESPDAAHALAEAAQNHAVSAGLTSIELRGGEIPDGWDRWDHKHCGFERGLAADDEAELLAIPRKARAEVRKAMKNGLEVRVGRDAQDLAAHYRVFSQSVRNLGTPVFPKRLFAQMLHAFDATSDILTISKNGQPVASVLSFYHDGAVMPYWGGGTLSARTTRANELMYYELMLHARRRGMHRFDFGRSKTNSGPYKFKKNWGFEPKPLTYGEWSAPGSKPRNVDPTNEAYSRKIAVWQKLPLPLANAIGPVIAKDLG